MHAQAVLVGLMQILEGMGAAPADSPLLTTSALDSLGALELLDAIALRFAVTLPATAVFDYPDLRVRMSTYMHLEGALHCPGEECSRHSHQQHACKLRRTWRHRSLPLDSLAQSLGACEPCLAAITHPRTSMHAQETVPLWMQCFTSALPTCWALKRSLVSP